MAGGLFLHSHEQQPVAGSASPEGTGVTPFSQMLPHLCRAENFLPTVYVQEFCQQRFCLFSDSRGVSKGLNDEVLLVQASSLH